MLDPDTSTTLFQNFFFYAGIVGMLFQDGMAHVDGIHKPLCLHVIKRQLVTCQQNLKINPNKTPPQFIPAIEKLLDQRMFIILMI